MKKLLKYSLRTLLCLLVLLLILPLAIYIPAVQRWGKEEIVNYVHSSTGMELQLQSLSVGFPLKLQLNNILLCTAEQDTLLQSRQVQVAVTPSAILLGKVYIPKIILKNTRLDFTNSDSTMQMSVNVNILTTRKASIRLQKKLIELPDSRLDGADVTLNILKNTPDTTSNNEPLNWRFDVGKLKLADVHYAMQTPSIQELDIVIDQAELQKGEIDLYTQSVRVDQAYIGQGAYRYIPTFNQSEKITNSTPSQPWCVQVQKIELRQNQLLYAQSHYTPQEGLDPSYLSFNNLNLTIDSLYNRGSEIRLPLKELSFVERSGLVVSHTEGTFVMDSTQIALQQLKLNTPYSQLSVNAHTHTSILEMAPQSPVDVQLSAQLAVADLNSLFPDFQEFTQGLSPSTQLQTELSVAGQLNDLQLPKGDIEVPGTLTAQLNGRLQELTVPKNMRGNLQWECRVKNSPLVGQLFNDSTLRIPDTDMTGEASLENDTIKAQSLINAEQGNIALNAQLNLGQQQYSGKIDIKRFPLNAYLPHNSLGTLSASTQVEGNGYNLTDTTSRARFKIAIDSLDYSSYRYTDLTVEAKLQQGNLSGSIIGNDPNLNAALTLAGEVSPERYTAHISGNLHTDLKALNLSIDNYSVTTDINFSGDITPIKNDYAIDIELTDFSASLPTGQIKTDRFLLVAETDSTHTQARIRNGDLAFDFSSRIGLDSFLEKINETLPILNNAIEERRIDMTTLHQTLPPFKLNTSAKRNNLLQQYLKGKDLAFSQLNLNLQNDSMLNSTVEVDRFTTAGITVDTIRLATYEQKENEGQLFYTLRIGNRPGNLDQLASVALNGFLSGNSTRLFCIQKNRQGQEGFRIGCQADFFDEYLQLSFFPQNPIIGFESWTLNKDNFFTYYYNKHFDADISLIHDNKHLIVTTRQDDEKQNLTLQEALLIDIKGIEIAPWLALSPFAPQIAGSVSADLQVDFPTQGVEVAGYLGINNFHYDKQRVGDFNLDVDYHLDSLNRHIAQASLIIDTTRVMSFTGQFDNKTENPVKANLSLLRFPLTIANPFLPRNTLQLQGVMTGEIALAGLLNAPSLNGYIQMDNASATSKSMGANLNFSSEPLRIDNNMLRLNDYLLTGANQNALRINGIVDLRKLDRITTDLTLQAREFQPVKSQRNTKATLYGSAITDMDMTVKGPIDALKIRGNIDLITGTEVTYVMQDSPLTLQQQENKLVTFVSFNDSIETIEVDTIPSRTISGMDILVNINIAPTVKMAVNLSVDGKNRIDLQGGGQLTYTLNPLGDSRFTGRYDLSSGFVRYTPPIISEKVFVIQDGSYITWNGEIADPYLSITAVETTSTSISENDKSTRQVDFEISIIIKNTLENLSIAFDLAAPEDLTIQNQLTSLTAEQRSSQAMSLLVYNTYTGPGTSSKTDLLGNPLNAFLQKELNQWAQENLKGIDLSFGINSYTDASGVNTRTDYSYRASKSLWNNRIKVVIGGSLSPDDNADVNFKENFIDDMSIEYYFNQRDNMYIKAFRQTDYEILEGEIIQMGVGFVLKKRLLKLGDLFRFRKSKEVKEKDKTEVERKEDTP